jgi:chemotaxis regulatin CheY-phosphate phosphatase CheZ
VYEELVESLKELTQRHSKYLKNEVSLTEMQNMCNILKKQLEQKEKINEDIRQQDLFYMNPQLLNQVEKKIEEMQGKLKDVRAEIRVKDQELQFLELVVEEKTKN